MKSPFLAPENTLLAVHGFAVLKKIDLEQKLDWFLYNHIVGYALYDPRIHTVGQAYDTGNLAVLKYLVDQGAHIHVNDDLIQVSGQGHLEIVK